MLISTYYRGETNKVSGFTFDTEEKTYKEYSFKESEWLFEDKNHNMHWKTGFDPDMSADIAYFTPTFGDMQSYLTHIQNKGFIEDKNMILDFGCFKK